MKILVCLLVVFCSMACRETKTCTPNYDQTITELKVDDEVYPVDKVFFGKLPPKRARSFHSGIKAEDLESLLQNLGFESLEELPKTVYCFLSCDMDGELCFSDTELLAVSLFYFRGGRYYNELHEHKEGSFELIDIKEWPTKYAIRKVENNYMELLPNRSCKTFYGIRRPIDSNEDKI